MHVTESYAIVPRLVTRILEVNEHGATVLVRLDREQSVEVTVRRPKSVTDDTEWLRRVSPEHPTRETLRPVQLTAVSAGDGDARGRIAIGAIQVDADLWLAPVHTA